jgi:hypothetical protein
VDTVYSDLAGAACCLVAFVGLVGCAKWCVTAVSKGNSFLLGVVAASVPEWRPVTDAGLHGLRPSKVIFKIYICVGLAGAFVGCKEGVARKQALARKQVTTLQRGNFE